MKHLPKALSVMIVGYSILSFHPAQAAKFTPSPEFTSLAQSFNIPTGVDGDCEMTHSQSVKKMIAALPDQTNADLVPTLHCLALKKHLSHDPEYQDFLPDPKDVYNFKLSAPKRIEGKMRFSGIVPLGYRYTALPTENGQTKINVKIFVHKWKTYNDHIGFNLLPADQKLAKQKDLFDHLLNKVSDFWSNNRFGVQFKVERVENKSNADYSIEVKESLNEGNLFDTLWTWLPDFESEQYGEPLDLVAFEHEFGHMMGLEDEYSLPQTILDYPLGALEKLFHPSRSEKMLHTAVRSQGCDSASIMCNIESKESVQDYQIYLILRRLLK